jgi:hypothetical protein
MARRRVKVGTLIGTEDRNDDDLIARTPPMKFGPGMTPSPAPTETTTPPSRVDASPVTPSAGSSWEGDGSGGNGPSGGGPLGEKDMTLADITERAILAASNMTSAPPGTGKAVGMASDVLGKISSEEFGRFGEKPGLGMQTKSQASGTLAQARAMIGADEEEEDTESKYGGYAPPAPAKTDEPSYNPAENADLGRGLGPAGQDDKSSMGAGSGTGSQSPTDGSFAAFGGQEHGNDRAPGNDMLATGDTGGNAPGGYANRGGWDKGSTPGQEASNNSGGDNSGGNAGPGGDTGGGNAAGEGGQGGPGDPSGSPGSGNFKDGVIDIEGPDPSQKGEAIPGVTLHEGETVLTDAETTLIGEKALRKVRQIAADKNTRLSSRKQAARSTLLSAARG